jgi:hypothetical protein
MQGPAELATWRPGEIVIRAKEKIIQYFIFNYIKIHDCL